MISQQDEWIEIGYITKLHGYKGELTIFLDTDSPADYQHLDHLFLKTENTLIPYRIENISVKTKKYLKLKLAGIDDEATAKKLVRSKIFIEKEFLSAFDALRISLHEMKGYKVIDAAKGDLGVVAGILELPANPQLQINFNGTMILLPIREEFIRHIDKVKKTIHVEVPDGLIELFQA